MALLKENAMPTTVLSTQGKTLCIEPQDDLTLAELVRKAQEELGKKPDQIKVWSETPIMLE